MTVVRDQLFPQKPPGSRFRFSRTGVQPSPGSSTIELPSAFAESGAYPPDRELPGSPRQCSLPLACRHPPEGHQIGARKRRTPENTILSQPYSRRVSTDRPNREGSQLAASLKCEPGPTPAGKTLPHSYPETRFRRERARECGYGITTPQDSGEHGILGTNVLRSTILVVRCRYDCRRCRKGHDTPALHVAPSCYRSIATRRNIYHLSMNGVVHYAQHRTNSLCRAPFSYLFSPTCVLCLKEKSERI